MLDSLELFKVIALITGLPIPVQQMLRTSWSRGASSLGSKQRTYS